MTAAPHFDRVIWIVLDSVGIGELSDAADYGDLGRDTLGHIARSRPLALPNLVGIGLANIKPLAHLTPPARPTGFFGKGVTVSPGKDTTTGHWEMVGIHLEKPFPVYPHGFPSDIMKEFEKRIGRRSLGNKAASGTEIIQELGAEHMRTGSPIVYTSADSVFQVAAHEEVIPLWELYKICDTARELLRGDLETDDTARSRAWRREWAYSRAATIYGGTSEIQKDIVATRLLGLPRSA